MLDVEYRSILECSYPTNCHGRASGLREERGVRPSLEPPIRWVELGTRSEAPSPLCAPILEFVLSALRRISREGHSSLPLPTALECGAPHRMIAVGDLHEIHTTQSDALSTPTSLHGRWHDSSSVNNSSSRLRQPERRYSASGFRDKPLQRGAK